jgi:hypothetical protein
MFDVFIMDMGGHDENVQQILSKLPHAHAMRYMTNHLEMIKRAANRSRTEFFWVIASCCDYISFDFNYIPALWENEQIHCWASGNQKFGDTFLINVAAWKKQENIEKLEWYQSINWHKIGVQRLEWPKKEFTNTLIDACIDHTFTSLYTLFYSPTTINPISYDMQLWENRQIIAFNTSGHVALCPRDVKQVLKSQIYDYRYILYVNSEKTQQNPQDIVFISYDEENAENNWNKLKGKFPRSQRVHGVSGMLAALKEAANKVATPYFYAVFAKTEINDNFDFNYNPDYLKEKSNYVFRAYNPVLDCSYGHGAIVMYNTQWMRSVESYEGDLTMTLPVVSVPIESCTNNFDETPWSAWRTAFREVYKLYHKSNKSIEDQYHLHLWLTSNRRKNGKWSKLGALHATKIVINSNKLNDWNWLEKEFNQCYEHNQ